MPNTDQTGAWRNPAGFKDAEATNCLLYTSDAADE